MKLGSCWVMVVVLTVVLLSTINAKRNTENVDVVQDAAKVREKISASLKLVDEDEKKDRTSRVRQVVTSAMKVPEKRQRLSEVMPIIRSMSIPQKLAMATLISTRISNTTSGPLEEVDILLNESNSRENASKELMLPISMDIAKIISDDSTENIEVEENEEDTPEVLPEAQELRRMRPHERRRPIHAPPLRASRPPNRRNVYTGPSRMPGIRPSKRPMNDPKRRPTENECTFFTKTVCLEATDYPHEAILRSLRSNKEMVAALLTDYKEHGSTEEKLPIPLENKYENRYENRYESNEIKRSDTLLENVEEGFTCPSIVKYARPQLARAASGVWKYIINTGEHTQTLRLEKCSNTHSGCSFISENYRSSCVQVYNYHRLLTWDQKLGLHMDIFKVPTCCSCHVHGYSELFPPHQKDPPTKPKETFPGVDFAATNDHKDEFQDLSRPGLNRLNKYTSSSNFESDLSTLLQNYPSSSTSSSNELTEYISFPSISSNKKPVLDVSSSRPSFTLPGRTRTKKPSSMLRPFEKLPQQHAPNTRAPGYKGPLTKGNRPNRLNRPPFRRDSASDLGEYRGETFSNSSVINRYSQPYDQQVAATSRLQNGGFDDEYQEPQRRINYNYHPIIDFFKPEAFMLQSEEPLSPLKSSDNAWKPMIS